MRPAQLEYRGTVRHGISVTLYGTYKTVVLDSHTDYIFEKSDKLNDSAKSYYRSLRKLGVIFHDAVEDDNNSKVEEVTEEPTQEEATTESVEPSDDESSSLYSRIMSLPEGRVKELLNEVGFSSRKRSLDAKVYEAVDDKEVAEKLAKLL